MGPEVQRKQPSSLKPGWMETDALATGIVYMVVCGYTKPDRQPGVGNTGCPAAAPHPRSQGSKLDITKSSSSKLCYVCAPHLACQYALLPQDSRPLPLNCLQRFGTFPLPTSAALLLTLPQRLFYQRRYNGLLGGVRGREKESCRD